MGLQDFKPNAGGSFTKGDRFNFDTNVDKPFLVNPTRLTTGIKTDYDKEGTNVVLVANLVDLTDGTVLGDAVLFNGAVRDQLEKYIEEDGEGMTVVRFAKLPNKAGNRTYNGVKLAESGDRELAEKWLASNPTAIADRLVVLAEESAAEAAEYAAKNGNGAAKSEPAATSKAFRR